MNLHELIDRLHKEHTLTKEEFITLIKERNEESASYLASLAREEAVNIYGNGVFPRGLVEFTNYCKNNCYYCGIQGSNPNANRYRLSKEEILSACENGYQLGYRSFVLQGGEDPHYTDEVMVPIVAEIRKRYPDCAITLSLGERSKESYQKIIMMQGLIVICFDMKLLTQSFTRNSTQKVFFRKPDPVSVESKRNRLCCRNWIYGWSPLSDG